MALTKLFNQESVSKFEFSVTVPYRMRMDCHSNLVLRVLSYRSLSCSARTGRREPWERREGHFPYRNFTQKSNLKYTIKIGLHGNGA